MRIYRGAGTSVKRKRRKWLGCIYQPPREITAPNQMVVHDCLTDTPYKCCIMDTFTRGCLALEVDTSFASPHLTRALDAIVTECGRPQRPGWTTC